MRLFISVPLDEAGGLTTRRFLKRTSQGQPSAARLLAARPNHSGYLKKKRETCLGFCPPQWQPRLFILAGRYLYRFKSDHSTRPKGTPIPVEGADVR